MKRHYDGEGRGRALASWFASTDGVIGRTQALELGVTKSQVDRWVRSGLWIRLYPGVYRLASFPSSPESFLRAALLVGGPSSYASHSSAAWLHGLLDHPGPEPTITVPANHLVRTGGLTVTRTRRLQQPIMRRRFPCTSVPRTILDYATLAGPDELDELIDRAVARRVVGLDSILDVCRTTVGHPGRPFLRSRLDARGIAAGPHPSVLESKMVRTLHDHGVPTPKAEVCWGPNRRYRLDFAYPQLRLVIEVNGWAYHSSPEQARRDSARRNALNRAGWTVLEFDWWEVTHEPHRVAADVAAAIARLQSA
jgi:hypothetical protein